MNIRINRKTNIDYDKILDGIVWIFYLTNTADKWKIRQRCVDLRDRQEVDDNSYPIYKGRLYFKGNAVDAETLYRQLQEICFQNDIELCVDGEIVLRDEDGNDIDSFEEV